MAFLDLQRLSLQVYLIYKNARITHIKTTRRNKAG